MKTRAIIYVRVSSQRQVEEGHGLEGQEKRCRDYAKNKNYNVISVFKDEGVSGGLIERKGMQCLQKELEKYRDEQEKSVVIVDDIKRLARDVEAHFELKRAIYTRNAVLESPSHRFEETPGGKFVETMLAAHAELERNENRIQVINRMKARLENGYWPFCMPIGLINKKDPIHGKILVRREPYATIFKEGIEKYRDGILPSTLDFKVFCNIKYKKYGITHEMSFSTATETLKEILYAGYIDYQKWNIPRMKAKHEGFISIETFDLVQERLAGRAKKWHRKDYSSDFPLRPFVLCDSCGKPMTGSYNTGRHHKRYPHYFCRTLGCSYIWKTTPKEMYESKFETLLSDVKPADTLIDLTRDVLVETWGDRLEIYTLERNNAQKELETIKKEIDDFAKLANRADDVLRGIYEDKIRGLVKKKLELEKKLKQNLFSDKDFGTASEKVFNILKKPMEMWRSDEYNDKRTIIFMYFEDNLRYDYYIGFGTANLAYPIKLINEVGASKKPIVEMSGSDPESKNNFAKLLQA